MGVVWFLIMGLFLTAYDRKMEGYGSRFVELLTAICFGREVFGGGVGDKTRVWMTWISGCFCDSFFLYLQSSYHFKELCCSAQCLTQDGKARDDNKRPKTGRTFAIVINLVRNEYTGTAFKCPNCSFHHNLRMSCHKCTNCNRLGHFAKDCRGPRMVTPLNARNPTATRGACFECGRIDHYKAACPSFVSTTFIPLLDIEPGDLSFSYEIEIASEKLVEINKVIHDCKLEIEGHTFDIDLIQFGHESFNMIVGIEWLSRHKAEIVCHKKAVRILLPHGKILRFLGEKPEEKVRCLMSAKAEEQKLKDIIIVRNFPRYFLKTYQDYRLPKNLSFGIDLILGAMPVLKSPYRLAPSEIEELSSQLRELYDKGFIRPSLSPWGAPGEEQEEAFQISKDKLCNVPVLALPDGLEDLVLKIHEKNYTTHDLELDVVVFSFKIWRHYLYGTKSFIFTDHKSLQHTFNQKEQNMLQCRLIELFSDYDCEIRYHSGKANVVDDALSRKERIKLREFEK
nr:hypothetical protein [Tanacetum cinerariifolium]GEZ34896.1 hypothetical protein [Tanacetum cinerariifolium]